MDKQELAAHLARRSRQSRGNAADKLDDLVYKLWKESRTPEPKIPKPKPKPKPASTIAASKVPVKSALAKKS